MEKEYNKLNKMLRTDFELGRLEALREVLPVLEYANQTLEKMKGDSYVSNSEATVKFKAVKLLINTIVDEITP